MKLRITIHGNAYEVEVEVLDPGNGFPVAPLPHVVQPPMMQQPAQATSALSHQVPPKTPQPRHSTASTNSVQSPIAGTIIEIKCKAGDQIKANQELVIIEAMKMETSIAAPVDGVISKVEVAAGDTVREGQILVHFE